MRFLIVGAGFSGAVLARGLAEQGHYCRVIDERSQCAGNCHTERDSQTGIMVHKFGPHIFHTNYKHVWDYVQKFAEFMPYVNRVKAMALGNVYSLPINLLTINQFFRKTFSPSEAEAFLHKKRLGPNASPRNFEEQALYMIGEDLYRAFFEGYTKKQWGLSPKELPASILKRLPVRFTYDDNYFAHSYQGIPRHGYTALVEKILQHPRLEVHLNISLESINCLEEYDHIFYTGPIDRYFNFKYGRLPYRTLDFEPIYAAGSYQGTAVMNHCDETIPFTRISEHKYFAPWEIDQFENTICFKEYSRLAQPNDAPYYPMRLVGEMTLLTQYVEAAKKEIKISFLGRLGTYRYLDMDVSIERALTAGSVICDCLSQNRPIPVFFDDPMQ